MAIVQEGNIFGGIFRIDRKHLVQLPCLWQFETEEACQFADAVRRQVLIVDHPAVLVHSVQRGNEMTPQQAGAILFIGHLRKCAWRIAPPIEFSRLARLQFMRQPAVFGDAGDQNVDGIPRQDHAGNLRPRLPHEFQSEQVQAGKLNHQPVRRGGAEMVGIYRKQRFVKLTECGLPASAQIGVGAFHAPARQSDKRCRFGSHQCMGCRSQGICKQGGTAMRDVKDEAGRASTRQ